MSDAGEFELSERNIIIIAVSGGAGIVLLVLCAAWIFFCCAMYRDKQAQEKIRQRWRSAAARARNMGRAFSRRTQRGRRDGRRENEQQRRQNLQRTRVHPSQSNLEVESETTFISTNEDVNLEIMSQLERSKNQPHAVPRRHANPTRPKWQSQDSEDMDLGSLLPRASVAGEPPAYESLSSGPNRTNASVFYNAAMAPALNLPGAVDTPSPKPTGRLEHRHAPYNPDYVHRGGHY